MPHQPKNEPIEDTLAQKEEKVTRPSKSNEEDWKEKLLVFKFNREKENGYRLTHEDYIEFIEEAIQAKDAEREKLLQQLENEQGIVFSEGHFRKLRKGVLGSDDWIEEETRAKLMDIQKEVNAVMERYMGKDI